MLWYIASGLFLVWLIMYVTHPKGWIHLLLISSFSIFFVQILAYRKTKYQREISKK